MARIARIDAAGAAHHVMVRGIERRQIFLDGEDRRDFVARLERLLPEEGWSGFAWVLMPNHVHLVLQGCAGGLSRLMARLDTGYAVSFNRRHQRSGYVFQNRFKSRSDFATRAAIAVGKPASGTGPSDRHPPGGR